MYDGPLYCRAEMYADGVAYCPLVNHVECATCALLTLEKDGRDRRTDEGKTVTLRLSLDAASVSIVSILLRVIIKSLEAALHYYLFIYLLICLVLFILRLIFVQATF